MVADITQILEVLASRQPAAPALHAPGRTNLSYKDLSTQIRYVRERLASWNISRGDIVAGIIPSRAEMAVACAAIPTAATLAPLSPALTAEVYCQLFSRLRPKAVVLPNGIDHPARSAARRCAVAEIALVDDPLAPAGMFALKVARHATSLSSAGAARADWAYVLTTSGTTGQPKMVPWSHGQLALFAQQLGDCLELSSRDVGCHLVPMYHSHGSAVALMTPLLRGSAVVCLPESDIEGYFKALDTYQVSWLTAVFAIHREILCRAADFPEIVSRNRLRCIKVSAGPLSSVEIDRMEQTFSAPLLVGYGTTEARMIAHDRLPPHRRKRGAAGVPSCNEVAIMGTGDRLHRAGVTGEIVVRGPLVFDGYHDDPQATAAAFVGGWFRTGDVGTVDDDGYLFLQGRVKEFINRGGEKISPAAIDAAIEAIPGVRAAATFAIPHQRLGEEIAAAVIRDGGHPIEAEQIVDHLHQRMGPKQVPRRIYFVDELPRTDSGKVRRAELPRLLGLDQQTDNISTSRVQPSAPTSPLEAALAAMWSFVLQVGSVDVNDDFFLLGGDSLRGARLLSDVRAVFGVELPMERLFRNASTVAGMAHAIEAERSKRVS